ncbi:hypothetical protein NC651_000688 [Populus alba x Populus x berolinensis]|nr:hypothetical protein NC651_000688 [Populus alba x Populus x berolinensis]
MLGLKSLHHQEMLGLEFPDIPKSRILREGQRLRERECKDCQEREKGSHSEEGSYTRVCCISSRFSLRLICNT